MVKDGASLHHAKPDLHPERLQLILVRHAESQNNVLGDVALEKFAHTPYQPGTPAYEWYIDQRVADPELSEKGLAQVDALSKHPYLNHIELSEIAKKTNFQVFSSPMVRALLTTKSLVINSPVQVIPHVCESGGLFKANCSRVDGPSPVELNKRFPDFDFSSLPTPNEGWWRTFAPDQVGRETPEAFDLRVMKTSEWLKELVFSDLEYAVVVCHAEFLDALLKNLLQIDLQFPGAHMFFHDNTGVTHLDLTIQNEMLSPRIRVINAFAAKV